MFILEGFLPVGVNPPYVQTQSTPPIKSERLLRDLDHFLLCVMRMHRKPGIGCIFVYLLLVVWVVTLMAKVDKHIDLWHYSMDQTPLANYLRYYRKRSGLSQREMAQLLGYPDQEPVSRHERSCCVPPLNIALSYQAIFREPVSDLFLGPYEITKQVIEERLAKMEHDLQQSSAKGRDAAMIARQLEWMWERKHQ